MKPSAMNTSRIVVLGTGFGAMQVVRRLDRAHFDVTVVSPRNYFLFTPLLASTTVGTIEFRSIIEPIRSVRDLTYYQAACEAIDPVAQRIECEAMGDGHRFELDYNHLVVAVGAGNNTFGVAGVNEHCLFLRDLPDARAIRQRIIEQLERASRPGIDTETRDRLLHFVVIGGGPTGVEFAAELHDFIDADLHRWFRGTVDHVRITLLESSGSILGAFDQSLSRFAARRFRRQDIDVRTHTRVTAIDVDGVSLDNGERLAYGVAVWSAGNAPTSLIANLDWPKSRDGRLVAGATLRVPGQNNVWALGDCAVIDGESLPPTAQVAQQQGKYLANNLNRLATGRAEKRFRFRHLGMLAYVGERRALADLPSVKGRGFATWVFWRSVYWTRLVSLRNKVLVVFDWLTTLAFGRDVSRF